MLSAEQSAKIKQAFQQGTLKIQSVAPSGEVVWRRVMEVMRNEVPWERILKIHTPYGSKVLTGGHKVFFTPTDRLEAENFRTGDHIVCAQNGITTTMPILHIENLPPRQFMYDLTADEWANFVSGCFLLKNSPDRYYHFRPPEYEGNLNQYNQVFGNIWEDAELHQYLLRALDWWNMFPPRTAELNTLDKLYQQKPEWRTAIYWGAITHACFALSINWTADEFSVTPSTQVRVYLQDGQPVDLPIEELYAICKDS